MEDANVKLFFLQFFSISYISKLTVTNIGSDLVMRNTIFMAVMVFAYTFVQIYWQKPVFFTFLPCSLVIKTDQQKFKVVSFIGWYDLDCGKSNIKRHIRMCLRDQSVTKKLLQLLGRPHRSFSVVQINYPPTCRQETLYFTLLKSSKAFCNRYVSEPPAS